MDEKMKGIEEKVNHPTKRYLYGGSFRDWKDADGDVKYLFSRVKELEERIQLAEATREDALAHAKGYKSELAKWTSPHEDSELQEMKEQSQQPSLSAKQAYINALEWTIKHQETKIRELI